MRTCPDKEGIFKLQASADVVHGSVARNLVQ